MLSSPIRHSRTRVVCLASICAALVAFVSLASIWQAATASAKKMTPASLSSFATTQPAPDKGVITTAGNAITDSGAHTPTVTNAATVEDLQTTSGLVVSRNPADGPEVTHFKIGNIVGGKVFKNDGTTEIPINTFITFEEGNAGLKFTPTPNNWGTLTFEVYSSTSNSDAGVGGIFARPNVTVQPLGDTPGVTNATTNRNTQTTFGLVITRNPVDGLEVTHLKITNIQNGTLFKNDGKTQINAGDFITFDEGNAGLKFTPANNLISPSTTFSFAVQASAGNSNAGLGGNIVTALIGVFDPIALTVNTLGDAADGNTSDGHCDTDGNLGNGDQCTLRAAIQEANVAPGDDTIYFDLPGNSIITLNSALPNFSGLTITGPGPSQVTVQRSTAGGTPNFRIFTIGPGNTVFLSGLTLSNGNANGASLSSSGGGILVERMTLQVNNCVITGNDGGSAGGGIYNHGSTVTVSNSTISNNTVTNSGGGIFNGGAEVSPLVYSGVLTVNGSTISNNVAQSFGGGGIYNADHATVTNSTISANSGPSGGGISSWNPITLQNVTVTGNNASGGGGGIYNPGIGFLTFGNTIVAGNTSPSGPDCNGFNFSSTDYNLIGNTSGGNFVGVTTHNLTNVDARLGPLANNGGPTFTHALLDGSPAIDAGNSTLATDQRGQSRPIDHASVANAAAGNASDIGAFEAPAFQVNSIADTNDGACTLPGTGNGCTLREAITAANAQTGADLITFTPALTSGGPATIELLTALPELSSDMTITGPGANLLTVQRSSAGGTPNFRIFRINSGKTVLISGLTMSNGNVDGGFPGNLGGGILTEGTLTVTNSTISGNTATVSGGGICVLLGTLTVNSSIIAGNNATSGGGIYNLSGLTLDNSTVSGNRTRGGVANSSGGDGGGIYNNAGASAFLNNSTINNNITGDGAGPLHGGRGGGIFSDSSLVLNQTTVSGNQTGGPNGVPGEGGGIYIAASGSMNVNHSTITNNQTGNTGNSGFIGYGNGGGICSLGFAPNIVSTIIAGNRIANLASGPDLSGNFISRDYNLIGNSSGSTITGTTTHNITNVNPLLGPLADNGGPTQTHALLSGSPALDAGTEAFLSGPPFTDQRGAGFNRIVDGPDADATATVDIGAFEQQASLTDIADQSTNEDVPLIISFDVGDPGQVTSITATSSNQVLVPNIPANINVAGSSSTRTLTIIPTGNMFGTANITITVNTTGGPTNRTFLLTVNSGNDAPSFTRGADQTVNEDGGAQTVNNWATNMSPGPADESGQTLAFQVTNNTNAALFSAAPAISTTGTLAYTPAANANGSATITVVLMDNGGTANGGINTSVPQTFTITVNPINDAPTFTKGLNQTVNEDAGAQTVTNWATAISPGAANESGQILTFQITANNNSSLFASGPTVSATGTLTYTPAANASGSANISIVLKDNGGTANGGVDTSASQAFSITVNSVNDAPSFTKGPDQTVNEDAGAQTVANWAGNLSRGPANESAQSLAFTATNNNNALFSAQPAISATGTLTYTAAPDANGAATVTVTLKDNGGTANGGTDTSASQTFTVTVNPVNDVPSFTKGADQTVNEDAGGQTVANWATAISAGPANESGQTLVFQITNNTNASLFSAAPAIGSGGTLTYTPAANANGSATITVTLKDDGGAANGGVDTSASQTFTITVNPVNDVPSFTIGADQTVNNNAGAQTVANWATNISAGPNEVQQVNFQVTGNNNPSLFVVAPAISSTGALTFTPATSAGGTAAITIILKDDGGTANGGQDTSPAQIFNLNVNPAGGSIKFNSASGSTAENSGSTTITVTRTGDLSQAVTVDYATSADPGLPCSTAGGVASPKCDFTSALGTLTFAAGEGTKTITVLISQDSFVEGPETFTVNLSNQTGGSVLATPSTETVTITDDVTEPPTNSIDDAGNFVRQHYHDFLNREPDSDGFAFWTNQIASCGSDQACIDLKRINVSAAFYVSVEFQGTGYLVERIYKAAYGDANGLSTFGGAHQLPVPIVRFNEFLPDTQRIGLGVVVNVGNWQQQLEDNKQAFTAEFVQRSRFTTAFPASMTAAQFVDALNTNASTAGVKPLSQSERDQLVNDLSTSMKTRAQVLRAVAEDPDLNTAEFNRAFVLMQYFGYLRRNPNDPQDTDYTGYDFWLTKLNQFNGNFVNAEMVKAFIVSGEYRQRFGP